jgi:LacI family transcriptional regulator
MSTLVHMKRLNKRPTQSDVARAAGVSRTTVSYVLNDPAGNIQITAETRKKVAKAAERLGYQPDSRAQSLRSGDSRTIGLLIPDIHNPHYWQVVEGVEEQAYEKDYDVLLVVSSLDQRREDRCLQALSRRTISGLLVMRTFSFKSETVKRLLASGQPVIEIGSPGPLFGFDRVHADYSQGMKDLLAYLLGLGHERFAFINGVAEPALGKDRLEVYHQTLKEGGIARQQALVINCGSTTEDGYQATRILLEKKQRPTAIIAINDFLALGVMRAVFDANLQIPEDISVASFDDLPMSRYLKPRLTTVGRDTKALGQLSAKVLIERLEGEARPPQILNVPTHLVIRESTGAAPKSLGKF